MGGLLKHVLVALFCCRVGEALWPAPTSMKSGSKTLLIDATDFEVTLDDEKINYSNDGNIYHKPSHLDERQILEDGVSRAVDAIFQSGLDPWMFHPRNESFEPDISHGTKLTRLKIRQKASKRRHSGKPDQMADLHATQADESYDLTISEDGIAKITANSTVGVLRALDTFTQLFYQDASGGKHYSSAVVPLEISDSPVYPHRGVLLDVSRSFYAVEHILRTIDALSWNKMNVLHIHATDSQTWPVEIPAIPELAAKGAYRPDMVYRTSDIQHIQKYGMERGVEVIFEIDQPAHIAAVAWSHPELITALEAEPFTWYCAEPPCGQLRFNDSAVDKFLDTVMDDLLPRLSPYGTYFSTGGDEIKANDSLLDPHLGTNDEAVIQDLLQRFTDKAHDRVRKHDMTPVVWQEVLTTWNVTLGKDVVVQTWDGPDVTKKVAEKGYQIVDSNDAILYLSCGRGEWQAYNKGAQATDGYPYLDWCAPFKSWQLIYAYDPTEGLTEKEAELILGAEACLWSETVDETLLDGLMWPRAAALGEVLWSGPQGKGRDQTGAVMRLAEQRERMKLRGVGAAPLQPYYCLQGGNCSIPYTSS